MCNPNNDKKTLQTWTCVYIATNNINIITISRQAQIYTYKNKLCHCNKNKIKKNNPRPSKTKTQLTTYRRKTNINVSGNCELNKRDYYNGTLETWTWNLWNERLHKSREVKLQDTNGTPTKHYRNHKNSYRKHTKPMRHIERPIVLGAALKDFLVGKYKKIQGQTVKIQEHTGISWYFPGFSLYFLMFS